MRLAITHRGPDDTGEYFDGNIGLAFNRLSIIDLKEGHQPMSNEDGSVWIVFNGEIYNHLELRTDLLSRGHIFRTHCDTEVIVHAWEEFGEACVEKLRGMFAFAIWDRRQRLLFGARDRLGIKPFFYHTDGESFAFASELKALLQVPNLRREVDPAALAEYLHHRYVIAPNTMMRSVKKLPPGHTIRISRDGILVKRYWEPSFDPMPITSELEKIEELDALLMETLRIHLMADVPLGAFLSGGLDSSTIVALMAKLNVPNIKTFSVGYDTPESELPYAAIVARHFHTDHHELRLTPSAFRDFLPSMVWHMDEPVGDEAAIPLFYLSQFARQKVTVALSGEGSDEIFAGYPTYRKMLAYEKVNRLPGAGFGGRLISGLMPEGKFKKYASMLGQPLETRYGGVSRVFSHDQIAGLLLNPVIGHKGAAAAHQRCLTGDPLNRMAFVDINTWLADDLLVKADRMSMANSLELRVPFLDHKLLEFALRLPVHLRLRGDTGKYLLKKFMGPLLPAEITNRAKKGFPVPTRQWLGNELSGFARETLLSSGGVAKQFFDAKEISSLLDAPQYRDVSGPIYSLIVMDQWYRQFVSRS